MADLFIELFPIETATLPPLTIYQLRMKDEKKDPNSIGGKLAFRLNRTFPGRWVWVCGTLLTDTPVSPVQMDITLDIMRGQVPELYEEVQAIEEDPRPHISPQMLAEFVLKSDIREAEADLRAALAKLNISLKNGVAERAYVLQTWDVAGMPSLSISLKSQVRFQRTLGQYLEAGHSPESAIGLRVMDRNSFSMTATLSAVTGTLGEHRERLLTLTKREAMQTLLKELPDSDVVFRVTNGEYDYEYPAGALFILIRPESDDVARFGLIPQQLDQAVRLRPDMRAAMVRTLSDVLKQKNLIGNAYNSRTHPALFAQVDFLPNLIFASNRVLPYKTETLASDFMRGGIYKPHHRFQNNPIRLAVINTLEDDSGTLFVEALRRQMEKMTGFTIDLIKERKVRVLNTKNIESAVRVVEKEDAHAVLAFFKERGTGDNDANDAHLKSLTLGKGIAAQVLYETTINNPDAMPLVMMGILAKTGNIPFALAEPLEYCNYVVGLGMVRERMTRGDRVTALNRIYRSDGQFVRYVMETIELEKDEPVPFVVMQTLFPQELFENQQVIIHHDGIFAGETLRLLARWSTVMGAHFTPVEILRSQVPRLYGLEGKVTQAPWGSFFRVNDTEGFIVTTMPSFDTTAQPLHIRIRDGALVIEQAVYSVLAWTLLHYGTQRIPKLPVTIQHSEDIAAWLAKGMLPSAKEGDMPFWL